MNKHRDTTAPDPDTTECSAKGCPATFTNHQWGKIRAYSAGWFTTRDGAAWCPDHTPGYVADWRESKASK